MPCRFLSPPSARRATRDIRCSYRIDAISIPALREEGDHAAPVVHELLSISIHALREEGDPRPGRGGAADRAISIHALREEGDARWWDSRFRCTISIHALREEGDMLVIS